MNLGMGQPDFDVPEELTAIAIDAMRSGHNGYSSAAGHPALREIIKTTLDVNARHPENDVVVTCGTLGALTLAMQAIINPGDEVILFDPYFLAYPHLVHLVSGTSRFLSTYPLFQPDPDLVLANITPRTKAIMLCSPSNPTGVVTSRDRVQALAELADRLGIWLISDEIYSTFLYEGSFSSPIRFGENVIVCSSFSKTHGMTGWRLGYAYGPKDVIEAMMTLQQATFVCAPTMAQHAGVAAWNYPMNRYVDAYRHKRDWLLNHLDPRYHVVKPEGAFYLWIEEIVAPQTAQQLFKMMCFRRRRQQSSKQLTASRFIFSLAAKISAKSDTRKAHLTVSHQQQKHTQHICQRAV
ncbi:MAG TPA: aminotransferase class I/II-fold pyridoxal phosphate-dependent enzyme, partial [Gemmatales bacterium]|nr:aminotransferase class I/II-fold pyridoxal phosphate-dependent enzyme [Gemmatales bacterium]